jgi:putative hydrolase
MLKIDLHLHTVASGHAHNTILEYINRAKELKMKIIGISDHGPGNDDTLVSEVYFRTLSRLPKFVNGIRILKGIEADIIDLKGSIDISDSTIKDKLDYVMANMHPGAGYKNASKAKNTQALIRAVESGKINIITHPFWIKHFEIDIEKVSEAACVHNVLLEVDIHYIGKHQLNPDMTDSLTKMIKIVKKNKKKVIVGSDAHNIWEMADDSDLKKIQKKIGLSEEMIINNYPKELFKILKIDE